jgi:hypothetical protein
MEGNCSITIWGLALIGCAAQLGCNGSPASPPASDVTVKESATCTVLPPPGTCHTQIWPGGVIPYDYDPSYAGPESQAGTDQNGIRSKMNDWEAATNGVIHFVRNSTDPHRVIFVNGAGNGNGGCASPTGVSANNVGIAAWSGLGCQMYHELGHIIGLQHQHQRADRDRYISVNPSSPSCFDNDMYKKCTLSDDEGTDYGPYDLSSTEEYGTVNFQQPELTLRSNGNPITTGMGPPTARDVAAVAEMYAVQYGPWKRSRPLGTDVGAYQPLDNSLAPGVNVASGTSPAFVRSGNNILIFARGTDGATYYKSSSGLGEPAWSPWFQMNISGQGSPAAAGLPAAGDIYIATNQSGAIAVNDRAFAVFDNGDWNIGAPRTASIASDPAIAVASGLGVYVFVRGSDNALWAYNVSANSGWMSLGGSFVGNPAAVSRTATSFDIFVNSSNGNLQEVSFNGTSTTWSSVPNGSCCLAAGSSPTVASPQPLELDVLFKGTDGLMWWKRITNAHGYETPKRIGGIVASNPSAAGFGGGRIDVVFVGDDAGLWHRRYFHRTRGDWNGDGLADFSLLRNDGTIHVRPSSGGNEIVQTIPFGAVPVIADWDADGKVDTSYVSEGSVYNWFATLTDGDPPLSGAWGITNDIPLVGDFDGDGRDDAAIVRPGSTDGWYIDDYSQVFGYSWGLPGDVLTLGDYDGDGKADYAVWRPSSGSWFVVKSTTGVGQSIATWGVSGDVPVPGDYDGDGLTDPAVFRQSNNTWYVLRSTDGGISTWVFGNATDRRVPRDYDGDGKTDPAFYRPAEGKWHFLGSNSGWVEGVITFGQSSDVAF